MKTVSQSYIDKVWLEAIKRGWKFLDLQKNIFMISFSRKNGKERINYYLTTGTVSTSMNHPTKGKTQLFRKKVDMKILKKIFQNPREHTGKGYYTKK